MNKIKEINKIFLCLNFDTLEITVHAKKLDSV